MNQEWLDKAMELHRAASAAHRAAFEAERYIETAEDDEWARSRLAATSAAADSADTALLSHLKTAQAPEPERWVDTLLVKFDDTVQFGLGYDFEGWECLRSEMHTTHGSYAVWPDRSQPRRRWSLYATRDGLMRLDAYSSKEQAQAEAEMLAESLAATAQAAPIVEPAGEVHRAIDRFEAKERGLPQAHIAAKLVAEMRAALPTVQAAPIELEPAKELREALAWAERLYSIGYLDAQGGMECGRWINATRAALAKYDAATPPLQPAAQTPIEPAKELREALALIIDRCVEHRHAHECATVLEARALIAKYDAAMKGGTSGQAE
jgi:hypothetical protein